MKRKDILFIFISTFIVVVAWIGFTLYHKWVTSTISEDLQMQIQPIEPNFDLATLQKLKVREKIIPLYEISNSEQEATISATPPKGVIPTTSPITSSSAQMPVTRMGQ